MPELVVGSGEKAGGEKFGSITAVGVDSKGGTYVFDASVPILRYFAADGKHVHELGREGSGAGEYGKVLLGVAVRKDGRLILGDPINARLTLYGSDGTVAEQWPIDSTVVITSQALTVDTADHTYLKVLSRAPVEGRLWPIKVLHLNDRGILVDAISLPVIAREPTSPGGPFDVAKIWAMSPFAYLVVGINDRYSFDILAPGRAVVRVMHDWEAVRLL